MAKYRMEERRRKRHGLLLWFWIIVCLGLAVLLWPIAFPGDATVERKTETKAPAPKPAEPPKEPKQRPVELPRPAPSGEQLKPIAAREPEPMPVVPEQPKAEPAKEPAPTPEPRVEPKPDPKPEPRPAPAPATPGMTRGPALAEGNPPAPYPEECRRRREEGTAVVHAVVEPDGKVSSAAIERSSGVDALDKSALVAVLGWMFVPALENGQPVRSEVDVPVVFLMPRSN